MTDEGKEKAIEYFKWWKSFNEHTQKAIPKDTIAYKAYQTEIGYYDMAIEALEQEAVLDKIRAEIEQAIREETVIDCSGGEYERTVSTIDLDDVLEILDKYKAESEKT
jgi:cyanate lyase